MSFYTEEQQQLQALFESRALADRLEEAIVSEELDERHTGFISTRDFFFLSTVNADGWPTVSYKGGNVGTVKVVDSRTIVFPAYDGNGMFLSMGNIAATAKIGLLFIDFERPNRMRLQATASVVHDDPLLAEYPGALALVRGTVDKVWLNCGRYVPKHQRVEGVSRHVPQADGAQPFPAWKRIDFVQDALRPRDIGRADGEGGTITVEQYGEKVMAGES